jgi:hypothetical protein
LYGLIVLSISIDDLTLKWFNRRKNRKKRRNVHIIGGKTLPFNKLGCISAKNKRVYLVLLSICTNFAADFYNRVLGNLFKNKKNEKNSCKSERAVHVFQHTLHRLPYWRQPP